MPTVTDFYRSYMCWSVSPNPETTGTSGHMQWGNEVRILIDARCSITNDATGETYEFYLIAPCRKEWMYRETGLIHKPSGEYRIIFADDRHVNVGKGMHEALHPHGPSKTNDKFNYVIFKISENDAEPLIDEAAILAETADGLRPIIAKTEIASAERGLRALLEYPIRTMNYNREHNRFQVDTGPLIFPDFTVESEYLIDSLKLAHAVFNKFDYVEFVCKQLTPLVVDGQNVTSIFDYSDFHELNVTTAFYAAN